MNETENEKNVSEEENEYELIQLKRSRLPPLRFYGRKLGQKSSWTSYNNRWDTYTLYETRWTRKYILYHEYKKDSEDKEPFTEAWIANSPEEAILAGTYEDDVTGERIFPETLVDLAIKLDIDIAEHVE